MAAIHRLLPTNRPFPTIALAATHQLLWARDVRKLTFKHHRLLPGLCTANLDFPSWDPLRSLRRASRSLAASRLRGFSSCQHAVSVAPLGLVILGDVGPTADAVGYHLSVLRTCGAGRSQTDLHLESLVQTNATSMLGGGHYIEVVGSCVCKAWTRRHGRSPSPRRSRRLGVKQRRVSLASSRLPMN